MHAFKYALDLVIMCSQWIEQSGNLNMVKKKIEIIQKNFRSKVPGRPERTGTVMSTSLATIERLPSITPFNIKPSGISEWY